MKLFIKYDFNIGIFDVEGKISFYWVVNYKDSSVVYIVRCILVSIIVLLDLDGFFKRIFFCEIFNIFESIYMMYK